MSTFTKIKSAFNNLSQKEKDTLLIDIYNFSNDMKLFLDTRLVAGSKTKEKFIQQMKRATIDKVNDLVPGDINGREVNAIISKAKKAKVDIWTMLELEKLAYQGFIGMMNEYGFWDERTEEMGCKHLGIYLSLIKTKIKDKEDQLKLIEGTRKYLLSLNNMCVDDVYDTFEEVMGEPLHK